MKQISKMVMILSCFLCVGTAYGADIILDDFEDGTPFPSNWVEGANISATIDSVTTAHAGPVKNGTSSMYWKTDITGVSTGVTDSWPTVEMPVTDIDWSNKQAVSSWLYFEMSAAEKLDWMIQLAIMNPWPTQTLVDWRASLTPGQGVPGNEWVYHEWNISSVSDTLSNVSHFRMRYHAEDYWDTIAIANKIGIYVDDVMVLDLATPPPSEIVLDDFEDGTPFPSNWVEGSNVSATIDVVEATTTNPKNGSYCMYWQTDITGVSAGVTDSWPTLEMPVTDTNWSTKSVVSAWLYFNMSTVEKLNWMIQLLMMHPFPTSTTVDWHAGDTAGMGVPGNEWVYHEWDISSIASTLGNVSHFRMRYHAEDGWDAIAIGNKIGIYVDDVVVLSESLDVKAWSSTDRKYRRK